MDPAMRTARGGGGGDSSTDWFSSGMYPGSVSGFCTEIGPEFDLSLVRSSELL